MSKTAPNTPVRYRYVEIGHWFSAEDERAFEAELRKDMPPFRLIATYNTVSATHDSREVETFDECGDGRFTIRPIKPFEYRPYVTDIEGHRGRWTWKVERGIYWPPPGFLGGGAHTHLYSDLPEQVLFWNTYKKCVRRIASNKTRSYYPPGYDPAWRHVKGSYIGHHAACWQMAEPEKRRLYYDTIMEPGWQPPPGFQPKPFLPYPPMREDWLGEKRAALGFAPDWDAYFEWQHEHKTKQHPIWTQPEDSRK